MKLKPTDRRLSRRNFLSSLGVVAAGSATLPRASAAPVTAEESVRLIAADVLVIGGGTAGTIAALQAGRLGASTVLVEAGSQLGGTKTTAGVDLPGLFHAWKNRSSRASAGSWSAKPSS